MNYKLGHAPLLMLLMFCLPCNVALIMYCGEQNFLPIFLNSNFSVLTCINTHLSINHMKNRFILYQLCELLYYIMVWG